MSVLTTCPVCGATYASSASGEPCPSCLLQLAIDDRDDPASDTGAGPWPRVFGDYELLEMVGRGGMGLVYRARQRSLDRIVALKTPQAGAFTSPAERKRFRIEAEAAARLQQPNIVAIHEVGEIDGQPYFTMDFVDGPDLASLCGGHPLPVLAAARHLRDIARAVAAAHASGVFHRDLKPSNVLIGVDGRPRVTDFGLARRTVADDRTDTTLAGQVFGSPGYISPEQATGDARADSTAADVYGLGALLYHLITGRAPFAGATALETLRLVRETEAVAPRLLNPGLPRDLETICLKCLRKDPVRRYASPDDVADELDRFLAGRPITARPLSPVGRTWRWCRRHPAVAGLTASLILVLSIATVTALHQARNIERARRAAETSRTEAEKLVVVLFDEALDDAFANFEPLGRRDEVANLARPVLTYYSYALALQAKPRDEVIPPVEQAVAILEELRREGDDSDATLVALSSALSRATAAYGRDLDMDAALSRARRAVAVIEKRAREPAAPVAVRRACAEALRTLGHRLSLSTGNDRAVEFLDAARAIQVGLLRDGETSPGFLLECTETLVNLTGVASFPPARRHELPALLEEAAATPQRLLKEQPARVRALQLQDQALYHTALYCEAELRLDEAFALAERIRPILTHAYSLDPTQSGIRSSLLHNRAMRRWMLARQGHVRDALQGWAEELEAAGLEPASPSQARMRHFLWLRLATMQALAGDSDASHAALARARDALAHAWQGHAADESLPRADADYLEARRAEIVLLSGEFEHARALAAAALARFARWPEPDQRSWGRAQRMAHSVVAQTSLHLGDFARVLEIVDTPLAENATRLETLCSHRDSTIPRALALVRLDRAAEARAALEPAVAFLRAACADNPGWCDLRVVLARALHAQALAQPGGAARVRTDLLDEATGIIETLPEEYRALRPVQELRAWIAADWHPDLE